MTRTFIPLIMASADSARAPYPVTTTAFFAGGLFAHAHGREVDVRAAAEARAEDLPRERVHDDPNLQLALVRDSDGYRGEL
jgi:hypothetical protein